MPFALGGEKSARPIVTLNLVAKYLTHKSQPHPCANFRHW